MSLLKKFMSAGGNVLNRLFRVNLFPGTGSSQTLKTGLDFDTNVGSWQSSTTLAPRTSSASPFSVGFNRVAYGSGKFVAVTNGNVQDYAGVSSDGVTWNSNIIQSGVGYWADICFGNGLFVAVSQGLSAANHNRVATSPDGITWTLRTVTNSIWKNVGFGNNTFFIISATIAAISTDTITWTPVTRPAVGVSPGRVVFGNGKFLVLAFGSGLFNVAVTSNNGSSWSTTSLTGTFFDAAFGSGLFIVLYRDASNRGVCRTSADGVTWSSPVIIFNNVGTTFSSASLAIAYGAGIFVATNRSSAVGNVIESAVSYDGGATWTPKTTGLPTGFLYPSMAYGGGRFVLVQTVISGSTTVYTMGILQALKGGGLVWIKSYTATTPHTLWDTVRKELYGNYKLLIAPAAQDEDNDGLTAFNNSFASNGPGFTLGSSVDVNAVGEEFDAESFKIGAEFFDIVPYEGTGSAQNLAHILESLPTFAIAKALEMPTSLCVYFGALGSANYLTLDTDDPVTNDVTVWGTHTSTTFGVGTSSAVNAVGEPYILYVFSDGPDSKSGSYVGTAAQQDIDCDFSIGARWVIIKSALTGHWYIFNKNRGMGGATTPYLLADTNGAQVGGDPLLARDSAGFTLLQPGGGSPINNSGETYYFFAIQ